jgi:hypothetical protein
MLELANCKSQSPMNRSDCIDSNVGSSVRKLDSTSTIWIVNLWSCYCGLFLQIIQSVHSIMFSLPDIELKDMLTVMTSPMHNSSAYRNRQYANMYRRLDSLNKRS